MKKVFRFRYKIQGPHVHMRVFAGGPRFTSTLALCGELRMTEAEFAAFRQAIAADTVQFREEDSAAPNEDAR